MTSHAQVYYMHADHACATSTIIRRVPARVRYGSGGMWAGPPQAGDRRRRRFWAGRCTDGCSRCMGCVGAAAGVMGGVVAWMRVAWVYDDDGHVRVTGMRWCGEGGAHSSGASCAVAAKRSVVVGHGRGGWGGGGGGLGVCCRHLAVCQEAPRTRVMGPCNRERRVIPGEPCPGLTANSSGFAALEGDGRLPGAPLQARTRTDQTWAVARCGLRGHMLWFLGCCTRAAGQVGGRLGVWSTRGLKGGSEAVLGA